jgi:virginiamycin B lyase
MRSFSIVCCAAAAALGLAACAGRQGSGILPAGLTSPASRPLPPGSLPGIVEIPNLPTIPEQIASDLAGHEWVAGLGPARLVEIDEQTHAITQFDLPNHNSNPYAIALGPNHTSMWFTELTSNTVGYIKLSTHEIHRYNIPTPNSEPHGLVAGPDNAMWFTEQDGGKIGRINVANGAISEYAIPGGGEPFQIALGPDGALWFTDWLGKGIGRVTTAHHFSSYGFKSPLFLRGITAASDGGLWFVGSSSTYGELVGRIDPYTHARKIWVYNGDPRDPLFVVNRNSQLWFTEWVDAKIARFDITTHKLHRFALPPGYVAPVGIALGSDDQLWFTEQDNAPQNPAVAKLCPSQNSSQCASSP